MPPPPPPDIVSITRADGAEEFTNNPVGLAFDIRFSAPVSAHIDPAYAETLRRVRQNGVEILVLRIRHTATGVEAGGEVPMRLE